MNWCKFLVCIMSLLHAQQISAAWVGSQKNDFFERVRAVHETTGLPLENSTMVVSYASLQPPDLRCSWKKLLPAIYRRGYLQSLLHNKLAAIARNGQMTLLNEGSGNVLGVFEPQEPMDVACVEQLGDNSVLYGLRNGRLKLIDVNECIGPKLVSRNIPINYHQIRQLAVIKSSKKIEVAIVGNDGNSDVISVYGASTWECVMQKKFPKVGAMATLGHRLFFAFKHGFYIIHVYDAHMNVSCESGIQKCIYPPLFAACGNKLIIIKDYNSAYDADCLLPDAFADVVMPNEYKCVSIHSIDENIEEYLRTYFDNPRSVVTVSDCAAILAGKRNEITIINQDGNKVQELSLCDGKSVWPVKGSKGLAVLSDGAQEVKITVFGPISFEQYKEEQDEDEASRKNYCDIFHKSMQKIVPRLMGKKKIY